MSAEHGGTHRLAAIAALGSAAFVAILAIEIVVSQFPRGLIVLACVLIAFAAAWYGLTRTGGARLLGAGHRDPRGGGDRRPADRRRRSPDRGAR